MTSVRLSVTVRPSVHNPTTSVRLSYVTPSERHTNLSVRPSATVPTFVRHPTRPSDHPPQSHRLYDTPISPSPCQSPADSLTATTIHHTHDSRHSLAVVNGEQSRTISHTHDSIQSLAVVNGEQSRKSKKFHWAFTNNDLLLRALDASSIYLRDFRRVVPPKSAEDAHVTRGTCDFGGATLNNLSLGCSYVLPRLWDPGGVSSSANTPRDQSRTIAPSRYPYALLTGYLINLPSLRR